MAAGKGAGDSSRGGRRSRGGGDAPPLKTRRRPLVETAGGGDRGTTGLLGGGRASKSDLRFQVQGDVDEASSALGLARALAAVPRTRDVCERLQRELYRLGAELATAPDRQGDFVPSTTPSDVEGLERLMAELEAEVPMPAEFVLPGATAASGALDLARAIARRAERSAVALSERGQVANPEVLRYLNRLSLLLFVLGRYEEAMSGGSSRAARGRAGNPPGQG